jgi:hypothetical protein
LSNYLNNLVARQLDRASQVRPRLPSLFEPPAYPSTLPHGQSESVAPLDVESIEFVSEINAPSETRRSYETRANTPSPRPQASNDEIPNTVWRGRQRITSSSKQSPESTSDETGEDSSQVVATHIQALPSTPKATRTDAASATPSPSAAPEETAPPRQNVRRPSPPLTASFERQDKASEQIVSPRLEPSTIDATRVDSTKNDIESVESVVGLAKNGIESTKNSLVFQPRVAALVENRRERDDSSPPLQSPASEPPPVINVTIGRIEVRAAVASNAPRRPEPSVKPLLSLDEYLRRRARGGGA